MTTATCAWSGCGRTFEAERADARYCSPNCRARASKERRRAEGDSEADAHEAAAKPSRPEPGRPESPRTDAARSAPAKPPPQAGPDEGPPFDVENGAPANAWERYLRLEERVDDLEYYGKEDWEKKVSPLQKLPARIDEVKASIPSEAKIKEWSREEALEALQALRERVEELENVVKGPDGLVNLDPAHTALERRVTTLEDPTDGGDASVRIKVQRLEQALADQIRYGKKLHRDIEKLAETVNGIMELME